MSGISTHILDLVHGRPAAGVAVKLVQLAEGSWVELARQTTDGDGRCRQLLPASLVSASVYRISFDIESYGRSPGGLTDDSPDLFSLYPEISITFKVSQAGSSYHMPLLLSPHGYTTYRGS